MFKFIQFFAELAQFHLHFRQTSLCDGCLEILFQLHRRGTEKLATVLYATGNTRLCAKVHFVANMNMTCNAYLPAEHAPFSYLGRTCYTYLRRHKLLDVIGDLALIGKPIKGRIIATRPGHTINNKFARQMRKEIRLHEIQAPTYDCNREPIMDVNRIRELLPHRYPMQLVDKVIEIGANYIVGVKNVTSNEPFFQGHFPQKPVMPGVLQIEAMAQTGGLLVLNSVDEPERYSTYFMKIDGVKFRQKVVPGDTLIFRVELMAPIRRGISTMKGYVFVGEKVVCEAEFMAQIVKNK